MKFSFFEGHGKKESPSTKLLAERTKYEHILQATEKENNELVKILENPESHEEDRAHAHENKAQNEQAIIEQRKEIARIDAELAKFSSHEVPANEN
jgi:hypothetical protein